MGKSLTDVVLISLLYSEIVNQLIGLSQQSYRYRKTSDKLPDIYKNTGYGAPTIYYVETGIYLRAGIYYNTGLKPPASSDVMILGMPYFNIYSDLR